MKTQRWILILLCLEMFLVFSCSNSNSTDSGNSATLPASWYKKAQTPAPLEMPSAAFDESVQTTFQANIDVLSAISQNESMVFPQALAFHPSDWVPWHLDGMIADFAIDVNGLFGVLLGTGTASVKVTWQQPAKEELKVVSGKSQTMHFCGQLSKNDIEKMLEPTVRAAVATGNIKDEKNFRKNLLSKGQEFVAVGQALDHLPKIPGWHVDTYQLQLTFNGMGQVTPVTGIGGTVEIYFDWQKADPAKVGLVESDASLLWMKKSPIYQGLKSLVSVLGPLVAEVRNESENLRNSGFDFDIFQLGVALTAGGSIGLAKIQAAETGKIYFKADSAQTQTPTGAIGSLVRGDWLPLAPEGAEEPTISIIDPDASTSILSRNLQAGFSILGNKQDNVFKVARSKFKKGLIKALHMATYFAQKAQKADTSKWKVAQIETEFDATIGGDFKIVTLSGSGQIVMDFDRVTAGGGSQ